MSTIIIRGRARGNREPQTGDVSINVTSTSAEPFWRQLSPFYLGPVALYADHLAQTFENAWQYAKVYAQHADATGNPTAAYWNWAQAGWADPHAVRFPMGRGAKPLYSLWNGEKLGYLEARRRIYAPLYTAAVRATPAYARLETIYQECRAAGTRLFLFDFDGYDYENAGMTLLDVLNHPTRKMGHAFVLAMLLQDECWWEEL